MSKEKREEEMAEIVEDGLLMKSVLENYLAERIEEFLQLPIMLRIFEENVELTHKTVQEKVIVEVKEIETPRQSIFDPRDLSVKLAKKANARGSVASATWLRPPREGKSILSPT